MNATRCHMSTPHGLYDQAGPQKGESYVYWIGLQQVCATPCAIHYSYQLSSNTSCSCQAV